MINWNNQELSGPGLILRYYPGIRPGRLRKTTKTYQDSRSPDRYLNPKLPNTKQEC
jgi:hypothetical protein